MTAFLITKYIFLGEKILFKKYRFNTTANINRQIVDAKNEFSKIQEQCKP